MPDILTERIKHLVFRQPCTSEHL